MAESTTSTTTSGEQTTTTQSTTETTTAQGSTSSNANNSTTKTTTQKRTGGEVVIDESAKADVVGEESVHENHSTLAEQQQANIDQAKSDALVNHAAEHANDGDEDRSTV